jgi:hypothetical protein
MEIKQRMQRSKHSNELTRRSFAKKMEPKKFIKNILDVRFVIWTNFINPTIVFLTNF